MSAWVPVCDANDIEPEDVVRLDHGGETYAVYRDAKGGYFATEGLCTHERVHLAEGFVIGNIIECARHQGRFNIHDGKTRGGPVCVDLRTFPVKIEGGAVYLDIDG